MEGLPWIHDFGDLEKNGTTGARYLGTKIQIKAVVEFIKKKYIYIYV